MSAEILLRSEGNFWIAVEIARERKLYGMDVRRTVLLFAKYYFGAFSAAPKTKGVSGVPPQRMAYGSPEANPQDLRPPAQLRCPPLAATSCPNIPLSILPTQSPKKG
jgi:hypothetical protein